jgi:hypothetical protein
LILGQLLGGLPGAEVRRREARLTEEILTLLTGWGREQTSGCAGVQVGHIGCRRCVVDVCSYEWRLA